MLDEDEREVNRGAFVVVEEYQGPEQQPALNLANLSFREIKSGGGIQPALPPSPRRSRSTGGLIFATSDFLSPLFGHQFRLLRLSQPLKSFYGISLSAISEVSIDIDLMAYKGSCAGENAAQGVLTTRSSSRKFYVR